MIMSTRLLDNRVRYYNSSSSDLAQRAIRCTYTYIADPVDTQLASKLEERSLSLNEAILTGKQDSNHTGKPSCLHIGTNRMITSRTLFIATFRTEIKIIVEKGEREGEGEWQDSSKRSRQGAAQ